MPWGQTPAHCRDLKSTDRVTVGQMPPLTEQFLHLQNKDGIELAGVNMRMSFRAQLVVWAQ